MLDQMHISVSSRITQHRHMKSVVFCRVMRRLMTLQCHASHRSCHALATMHPHKCSPLLFSSHLSSPLFYSPHLTSPLISPTQLSCVILNAQLISSVPLCSALKYTILHFSAVYCTHLYPFVLVPHLSTIHHAAL